MESAVVSQDPILNANDIDFDSILQDFYFDLDPDFDLLFSDPQLEDAESPKELENSESLASFADEIEKFLMEDSDEGLVENGDKRVDELVSDLIIDVSGPGSDSGKSGLSSPESVESEVPEVREEEDEQNRKKRRRQMRNRESAMQSRERKKMYVKDLETKSKYLESECRRLDYALRCCQAENFALHQRLQKGGALAAKQESAVLFVESLLLGSLFWLVSIVFLFLLAPSLQIPNPKGAGRLGRRGLALEVVGSKTLASKKSHTDLGSDVVILRRRCRGSRTRMKSFLFPLHAFFSADVF